MLDQSSNDYQNASAVQDVSAFTKQSKNEVKPAEDCCPVHVTEEMSLMGEADDPHSGEQ